MTLTEKKIRDLCSHYADWYPSVSQIRELIALAQPEQGPVEWKLMPREATDSMLKAMDECSTEGYDERLYAGHAASVYMAAWDAYPDISPQPEQNLNCKSTQARLAAAWGYVKAQTEQEPVAEVVMAVKPPKASPAWIPFKTVYTSLEWLDSVPVGTKLYTTPPQRKPLSDEQIGEIGRKYEKFDNQGNEFFARWGFARAIEAAHGIKENK